MTRQLVHCEPTLGLGARRLFGITQAVAPHLDGSLQKVEGQDALLLPEGLHLDVLQEPLHHRHGGGRGGRRRACCSSAFAPQHLHAACECRPGGDPAPCPAAISTPSRLCFDFTTLLWVCHKVVTPSDTEFSQVLAWMA